MSIARKRPTVTTILASTWLIVLTILALTADYLPFIRAYNQRVKYARNYNLGPGSDFFFGSDQLGRDIFARCIYGAQISLVGRFDVLSATNDSLSWLTRTWSITFVLSLLSIAPIARIVRAQTLSLSQREFVLAARSLGAKSGRVIFREIVPNLIPAMTSVVFTGIAILLVSEGGLAFLGYSVKPPSPSWGLLVSENREKLDDAWWATIFPCIMLFVTVLSFNMIGDRVARKFDIREAAL